MTTGPAPRDRAAAAMPWRALLAILVLYWLGSAGRSGNADVEIMLSQGRALMSGRISLLPGAADDRGPVGLGGLHYSQYGILGSLFWIPFQWAGRAAAAMVGRFPAEMWEEFFASFSAAILVAGLLALLARAWLDAGASAARVRGGIWFFGFCSLLWPYSKLLGSDVMMAGLILGGVVVGRRTPGLAGAFWAGLFWGAALLCRKQILSLLPVLFLWTAWLGHRDGTPAPAGLVGRIVRHVLAAVAGFAPGLLLQLAWNHIRYGHPLSDPTPNAEQVTLPDWQQFRERLFGQLLSSGRGMALFHLAPAVVICLAFREWWRRAHDLVVLWIGCTAATLLFFTLFDFWHGGTSYGPRYTLALLALGATAWGHLPERPTPAARTALAAAAVAGFLTMVPGVLVDPVCIDMHHQWLMEYRRPWLAAGWAEVRAVTTGTRPKLPPGLPASAYTLETHPQFQVPDLWWCHLVHRLRDSRASSGSVPAPVPTTRP